MKILLVGCNGFIGSHLVEHLLSETDWEICGIDINNNNIKSSINEPNFTYHNSDITKNVKFLEKIITQSDFVIPLAAIARPKSYITKPLKIIELNFEANLFIIRKCLKYKKCIIFPSTSEVYGLCDDIICDEDNSSLTLGPINKSRWIYSCAKQLIDRIIWAFKDEGLNFTIFRPFNWIGPNLDDFNVKNKTSRVITQFFGSLIRQEPIEIVDGGEQKRTFTDIRDGIRAIMKILLNQNIVNHEILNIGYPENEYSINELADMLISKFRKNEHLKHLAIKIKKRHVSSNEFYGNGYQDVMKRVPDINKIKRLLDWEPEFDLNDSIDYIVDNFINNK